MKKLTQSQGTNSVLTGLLAVSAAVCLLSGFATAQERKLTDQAITDHIDDELIIDSGVPSWKIDITTNNGIVKLSGTVSNILAKERAARIAETVRGVRAVINEIHVKPLMNRTDSEIAEEVDRAFVSDPAAESWQISESVSDGVVTLTGTVDSFAEKELAGTIAKGVRGVQHVNNQIDVNYRKERTDAEIREDIAARLKWSVLVDDGLIDVKVQDGHVSLSGTVGSAAEKRQARMTAWTAGVRAVEDSELEVRVWARDSHRRSERHVVRGAVEIQDAIQDALLFDPRVMSFNVDVDVYGSTVTLRGEVDNLAAKRAAEQVASNTLGVKRVTNRLKVRPAQDILDNRIEQDIETALLRDPYVERFEIRVSVTDSVAILSGTVDSWFEKTQAEIVAGNVKGVVDVRNNLTLESTAPYKYDPYLDPLDFDYDYTPGRSAAPDDSVDQRIAEDVRDELWWSPFVDSDQIQVEVNGRTVTLSGEVDSNAERAAAVKNAYDAGAFAVINELEVKS